MQIRHWLTIGVTFQQVPFGWLSKERSFFECIGRP